MEGEEVCFWENNKEINLPLVVFWLFKFPKQRFMYINKCLKRQEDYIKSSVKNIDIEDWE